MCRVVCWAAPGQKGAGVGGPTFASGAALTVWKDFRSPTVEAGPHPRDGKGRTLSIERMPVSNDEVDMAVDQNSPPCARTHSNQKAYACANVSFHHDEHGDMRVAQGYARAYALSPVGS